MEHLVLFVVVVVIIILVIFVVLVVRVVLVLVLLGACTAARCAASAVAARLLEPREIDVLRIVVHSARRVLLRAARLEELPAREAPELGLARRPRRRRRARPS